MTTERIPAGRYEAGRVPPKCRAPPTGQRQALQGFAFERAWSSPARRPARIPRTRATQYVTSAESPTPRPGRAVRQRRLRHAPPRLECFDYAGRPRSRRGARAGAILGIESHSVGTRAPNLASTRSSPAGTSRVPRGRMVHMEPDGKSAAIGDQSAPGYEPYRPIVADELGLTPSDVSVAGVESDTRLLYLLGKSRTSSPSRHWRHVGAARACRQAPPWPRSLETTGRSRARDGAAAWGAPRPAHCLAELARTAYADSAGPAPGEGGPRARHAHSNPLTHDDAQRRLRYQSSSPTPAWRSRCTRAPASPVLKHLVRPGGLELNTLSWEGMATRLTQ